jgi:integrase
MSRGINKLTATQVKSVKGKSKVYRLGDGGGLCLYVKTNGSRLWQWRYKENGKDQNASFGIFPDVTLGMARRKAEQARKDWKASPRITPKDRARLDDAEKAAEERMWGHTFETVARAWYEEAKEDWKNPKHQAQVIGTLEAWVFPHIGKISVSELRAYDVRQVIQKITKQGKWETAQRVYQRITCVLDEAVERELVEYNVAQPLRKKLFKARPKDYKGNFAALAPDELPELTKAIKEASLLPTTELAVKLSMLTAVRPNELRHAEWSEFDLEDELWLIPAEKMKMGRDHLVPLSEQVLEVLYKLEPLTGRNKYLFPHRSKGKECMSEGTVNMALKRIGFGNRTTAHGFRALFSTWANERGQYQRDSVERQLSHLDKNAIRRAYNRAEYLEEREKMMQDWGDFVTASEADNVTPIGKKKAS